MPTATLYCNKCQKTASFEVGQTPFHFTCTHCSRENSVEIFPALFRHAPKAETGERLQDDGESACYYHPKKRASVPCDACGRYLCALCDIETAGRHLCPSCVGKPETDPAAVRQPGERTTYYDNIALALALFPMLLFFYPSLLFAPVALYIAIRYWNKTNSVLPRNKWRNVVAILVAGGQLAVWVVIFGMVFFGVFY